MKRRSLLIITALALMFAFAVPTILPGPGATVQAAKKKTAKNKVALNRTKATLTVGRKLTLKVINNKKKVTWKSFNKQVAAVSNKGIVTAKKAGKATIIAQIGKKKYKCYLTVKAKAAPAPVNVKLTLRGRQTIQKTIYIYKVDKDGKKIKNSSYVPNKYPHKYPNLFYQADECQATITSVDAEYTTSGTTLGSYTGMQRYNITIKGTIPNTMADKDIKNGYIRLYFFNNQDEDDYSHDYYFATITENSKSFNGYTSTFTKDDSGNFTLTVQDVSLGGKFAYCRIDDFDGLGDASNPLYPKDYKGSIEDPDDVD